MINSKKLNLDRVRTQLGMVNNIQDPIMRGQKLALISAEITAAAQQIQTPFRQSQIASAIRQANLEPRAGVVVPKREPDRPKRLPNNLKGLSRFGRATERGVESFADWLVPGQANEYIDNDIVLSSIRGIGRLARKVGIMANAGAASKGNAMMRGSIADSLKKVEQARELAMQKPKDEVAPVVEGIERAKVNTKLDEILKRLDKLEKSGDGLGASEAISALLGNILGRGKGGKKGGKPGSLGKLGGRLLGGAATVGRIARIATPVGLATTVGYYGIKSIAEATGMTKREGQSTRSYYEARTTADDPELAISNVNVASGKPTVEKNVGSKQEKVSPGKLGLNDPIAQFVAKGEGVRTKAYKDSGGYPTIGVGHLITKDEIRRGSIDTGGDPIIINKSDITETSATLDQIKSLFLERDLPKHAAIATRELGPEAWGKLNVSQKAAVVSYAFNRGTLTGLIKRGLRDAIMAGDTNRAAGIIANGVSTSGGKFVPGLVNRRNSEAQAFKNGIAGVSSPPTSKTLPTNKNFNAKAQPKPGQNAVVENLSKAPKQTERVLEKVVTSNQQSPQIRNSLPGVVKNPMQVTRNPPSSLQQTQRAETYRSM